MNTTMIKTFLLLALISLSYSFGFKSIKKGIKDVANGVGDTSKKAINEVDDITKPIQNLVLSPQASQSFPEYVKVLHYPCETHYINTSDGYNNTYFRIQAKNSNIKANLSVVYLQHGFLDSSDTFIINKEDQAIAFILANAGYDVWVGNTRGNFYSESKVKNSNDTANYWDFSWQDMALYDVPAAFEYIHNHTGQNITYIGHGQGASLLIMALSSEDPTVLKYLNKSISIAPISHMNNLDLYSKAMNKLHLDKLFEKSPLKHFWKIPSIGRRLLAAHCSKKPENCLALLEILYEVDPRNTNLDRLFIFFGHYPAGTSQQNLNYWKQLSIKGSKWHKFDYGKAGNLKHYGQSTAPKINLSKIKTPMYLIAGSNDRVVSVSSVEKIKSELKNSTKVDLKTYKLGHMSFVWGNDVMSYFKDVLEFLKH